MHNEMDPASFMIHKDACYGRFEPDMLAFSGCYYGGGEKERRELGALRRRWKTLHVKTTIFYVELFDCFLYV